MVFLGDLMFPPHLTIDSAQNEGNNLDGPSNLNPKKKKKKKKRKKKGKKKKKKKKDKYLSCMFW